jgi:hypothetical protein
MGYQVFTRDTPFVNVIIFSLQMKRSDVARFAKQFGHDVFQAIHRAGFRVSAKGREISDWQIYLSKKMKMLRSTGKIHDNQSFGDTLKALARRWRVKKEKLNGERQLKKKKMLTKKLKF